MHVYGVYGLHTLCTRYTAYIPYIQAIHVYIRACTYGTWPVYTGYGLHTGYRPIYAMWAYIGKYRAKYPIFSLYTAYTANTLDLGLSLEQHRQSS